MNVFRPELGSRLTAITCAVCLLVACSSRIKAPPERTIKAAIAEDIILQVLRSAGLEATAETLVTNPNTRTEEGSRMQMWLQMTAGDVESLDVGDYVDSLKGWPVVVDERVYYPVGRERFEFIERSRVKYIVQRLADGSVRARLDSTHSQDSANSNPPSPTQLGDSTMGQAITAGLHEAARTGDLVSLAAILDRGCDINSRDAGGMTPLCLAAWEGHEHVVGLLLKRGADVNTRGKGRASPLWIAASRGYATIVSNLLSNGADIGARDNLGYGPLHEAAGGGHRDVAEILLKHGAAVDARAENEEGYTPLIFALMKGSAKTVNLLLNWGADPNVHGKDGLSPLQEAVIKADAESVALLLDKGADPNARGHGGLTPLATASRMGGRAEIIALLLARNEGN